MNLHQHYLTKNECYKIGQKLKPQGLMIHSTGVDNPNLSRYVDAPELGNISSGHWNQFNPGGRQVCVHGFIGKDKDGDIATYNTLPWDMRGWHAGGSGNNTHIGVEICEDDLKDPKYFAAVYKEAVELFVYLCKKFDLTEKDVTTHCEGFKNGIASNHADVMHWFPKHGKSIDTFRADIKKGLAAKKEDPKPASKPATTTKTPSKSIDDLAEDVIAGKLGDGDARKKALGSKYDAVQKRVAELLKQPKKKPEKSIRQLALEVIKGVHGSGRERHLALGSKYDAVQKEVNKILTSK